VNFQEYLLSKKIDSDAFRAAEGALWESWREEFEMISPTGFTAQKLFLINPIRRKYPAKMPLPVAPVVKIQEPIPTPTETVTTAEPTAPEPEKKAPPKPAVPRPVFKPKPKTT
jgi:outer membrane biosynthesis protein TonB